MHTLAQVSTDLGTIGGEGLGPFGKTTFTGVSALAAITRAVSSIIGFLTIAASIWFLFQILIAGISWITSGGDKNGLESARNRLTHSFIGLIIVVAGWAILALVGQFLGYDILITNPANFVNLLQIK